MEHINKSRTVSEQSASLSKSNQVGTVILYGIPIVSLIIESQERLCLAQISNTLLKQFSYNEIHNRRVALGITCVQCTPVQLEILRRAGAMPVSSRRCGMITRREAERLCKSFLGDNAPPRLPEDFAFSVHHECAWGCRGSFLPSRYNSSRAKCIKCSMCGLFFSPNKFIFHSHRIGPSDKYVQPDAANFNSWRRHMKLSGTPSDEITHAWEDVKAMFNGGTRKRLLQNTSSSQSQSKHSKQPKLDVSSASVELHPQQQLQQQQSQQQQQQQQQNVLTPLIPAPRLPNFQEIALPISRMAMDLMSSYHKPFPFAPYSNLPWFKRNPILFPPDSTFFGSYQSAFKPVYSAVVQASVNQVQSNNDNSVLLDQKQEVSDDEVDIETTDDNKDETILCNRWSPKPDSVPSLQPESPNTSSNPGNGPDIPPVAISPSVVPKPEFISGTRTPSSVDRMWNIGRVAIDRTERNNLFYRHEFQRNFIINKDDTVATTSPIPIAGKTALNCSACQNPHGSVYCNSENNNKSPL